MLLEQRSSEAMEPCEVLSQVLASDAGFVRAAGDIKTPLARVFDPPMAANGVGKTLHSPRETADDVADFRRLFPVANARQQGNIKRREFKPRQSFRCWHLHRVPNFFATVPLLLRDVTTGTDVCEVGQRLFVDLGDDRVVKCL